MKETKFIFDFDLDVGQQRFTFLIHYPANDYNLLFNMSEQDDYEEFVTDMENYGVHDFITIGEDQLFGFHSYEVDPNNVMIVMNKWHKFFQNKGYTCDQIVEEEYPPDDDFIGVV